MKIFAAELASREGISDEVSPEKKTNLLKKFEDVTKEQEQKRKVTDY